MDARLFYYLLLGEMEARAGDAGAAYQVMLETARRTRNEQVFRRATDIALQARAGDQALAAIVAWRTALPESTEALRYQVQLLAALNRGGESLEPLTTLLRLTPVPQQSALLTSLPRLFAHSADRRATAELLSQALAPLVEQPETRVAARATLARAWQAAQDNEKALGFVRSAHQADPQAPLPALLAMELFTTTPGAETVVSDYVRANPNDSAIKLLYARRLAASQRFAPAAELLGELTRSQPKLASAWLALGAVQLEGKRPAEATSALQRYVQLIQSGEAVNVPLPGPQTDGDDAPAASSPALTDAWLLLAQAAEQQRNYAAAEAWLARVDDPQRMFDVQQRRASLLARQGKLKQARDLIQQVPESTSADARAKLIGEAHLLREQKAWAEADKVLAKANQQFPDDVDLLYEKAMTAEKLNRMEEMERLLRRVIALNPEHPHAYNALGYSLADRRIRLAEARELILKALALSPGEPFITDSLGWVEYRLGNHAEALRLLREAYQARPDPEIAAHYGEVLWATGRTDEARRVWRDAKSRDAANQVLNETLARLRVQL
jgi:tetratricopeptide (TPR) repeat protein